MLRSELCPPVGGLRARDELGPYEEARFHREADHAEKSWGSYAKGAHHQHHRHSPQPLRLRKGERHGERGPL
jgi:hypothetical protein